MKGRNRNDATITDARAGLVPRGVRVDCGCGDGFDRGQDDGILAMRYNEFIRSKAREVKSHGFHVDADKLNTLAWDWQRQAVSWALHRGRAAFFQHCGLGKTLQQLLWAEQIVLRENRSILLLSPIAVRQQTIREAAKFNINVEVLAANEQADIRGPAIYVSNYEKLHKFDHTHFVGVVIDESSCLKEFKSKTRRELCRKFANTQYRLACTATPAPNEWMELGNHCDFLSVMPSNEMLSRWFINDTMKAGEYKLLDHASSDYWRWVCGWALCLSKPSNMGNQYSDEGFIMPPINYNFETVEVEIAPQPGELYPISAINVHTMHREKRQSCESRANRVAEIVATDPDDYWIVWCDTDYEADQIVKVLPKHAVEVRGSMPEKRKEKDLSEFAEGKTKLLITKPEIGGLGLNLQHCRNMAFVGLSYSFERFFQALHRCYRFGQKRQVNAWIVQGESESAIADRVFRKRDAHEKMQSSMADAMKEHQIDMLNGDLQLEKYQPQQPMEIPKWLLSKTVA